MFIQSIVIGTDHLKVQQRAIHVFLETRRVYFFKDATDTRDGLALLKVVLFLTD
jgi:hypothetical protein